MHQTIRAFLIALFIPVLLLSGCGAPLNAPIATPSVTDSLTEESFAEAVHEFVSEYGDTAFDALSSHTPALTEAELAEMTEVERLIATIPAEQNLAYDEAYCCRLESDGSLVLIMGIGQVDTVEKVQYLFPNVEIREQIGDYRLTDLNINGNCYYNACMPVSEHNGTQTPLTPTPEEQASTFQEGERYPFKLPAPGTELGIINLQYENGVEGLYISILLLGSPIEDMLSKYKEGVAELGSEFERYFVQFAAEMNEAGYKGAVYAGESAGFVSLYSYKLGTYFSVLRDAEEFASLLRELDLPAMLAGAQKAMG